MELIIKPVPLNPMKKIALIISCLGLSVLANAQLPVFEWAKTMGGTADDGGSSIALDPSGNIYVTGKFQGTVDFDPGPGTFNLTSAGGYDIFISKSDPSGNLMWSKSMGSFSQFEEGNSITIDISGNVYTTGRFGGTTDFDPGPGIFNLIPASSMAIFISKLDMNGNFVWARGLGGIQGSDAYTIAVDATGNVFTTGDFWGTADFDPGAGTFNLTSAGELDIFISKLDASGNFAMAISMGGPSIDFGSSIAFDVSGNVYATGIFQDTADFWPGGGVINLISAGDYEVFIAKYSSNLFFSWAKSIAGTSSEQANSILVNASGNIHITGRFSGTADFNPGSGTFNLTPVSSNPDIFISKLDLNGNFVWAKQMGGSGHDVGWLSVVDASGHIYTTGRFRETSDFDPGPGTFNLTSMGNSDIFISKLDINGNFVWAKGMGGISEDKGYSIAVDGSGNVYSTGSFNGTVDFDPDTGSFNLTSSGGTDIFVHKIIQCTTPSASISPAGAATICSGNSVLLNANTGTGLTYQWKNNGTNISGATNSTYTATVAGSYTVAVTNSCGTATSSATTVTVNSLPSATITPAGPTTFCSGGSVVLNAPVAANRTYQWKKGANLISGATLSSYTATTGGNYKVIVTNTVTGCSKTTASATIVTVNAKPAATITPLGPTTFCAGGSVVLAANTGTGLTYKWKKGSNFISGATLSNYTATTGGNYRVQVTNGNGCSKVSGLVAVSVPCREGEIISSANNLDFNVYPNPNSGEFTIKFLKPPTSSIQIELTDEIGKVVKRFETNDKIVVIKESNLAKGIYCLTARNKNEEVRRKISVVK